MNTNAKKAKQIVVNVSDESKTEITSLKEKFDVSDKEFIAAVLVIIKNTADDVIKAAVETVTAEKEKSKLEAKIAKIEAQLAKAKGEAVVTSTEETPEEVLYEAGDEVESAS